MANKITPGNQRWIGDVCRPHKQQYFHQTEGQDFLGKESCPFPFPYDPNFLKNWPIWVEDRHTMIAVFNNKDNSLANQQPQQLKEISALHHHHFHMTQRHEWSHPSHRRLGCDDCYRRLQQSGCFSGSNGQDRQTAHFHCALLDKSSEKLNNLAQKWDDLKWLQNHIQDLGFKILIKIWFLCNYHSFYLTKHNSFSPNLNKNPPALSNTCTRWFPKLNNNNIPPVNRRQHRAER